MLLPVHLIDAAAEYLKAQRGRARVPPAASPARVHSYKGLLFVDSADRGSGLPSPQAFLRARSAYAARADVLIEQLSQANIAEQELRYFPLLLHLSALRSLTATRSSRGTGLSALRALLLDQVEPRAFAEWLQGQLPSRRILLLVHDNLGPGTPPLSQGESEVILQTLLAAAPLESKPPLSLIEWPFDLPKSETMPVQCAHAEACSLPGLAMTRSERDDLRSWLEQPAQHDLLAHRVAATLPDHDFASDSVEETVRRLWREDFRSYSPAFRRLEGDPCPFLDWISVIVINDARRRADEIRRCDGIRSRVIAAVAADHPRELAKPASELVLRAERERPGITSRVLCGLDGFLAAEELSFSDLSREDVVRRALIEVTRSRLTPADAKWAPLLFATYVALGRGAVSAVVNGTRQAAEEVLVSLFGARAPVANRLRELATGAAMDRSQATLALGRLLSMRVPCGLSDLDRATRAERLRPALIRVHSSQEDSGNYPLAPPKALPPDGEGLARAAAASARFEDILEAALAGLHAALHAREPEVRAAAVSELAHLGDSCVLAPVRPLLSGESPVLAKDAQGRPGPWLTRRGLLLLYANFGVENYRTLASRIQNITQSANQVYYKRALDALIRHWSQEEGEI